MVPKTRERHQHRTHFQRGHRERGLLFTPHTVPRAPATLAFSLWQALGCEPLCPANTGGDLKTHVAQLWGHLSGNSNLPCVPLSSKVESPPMLASPAVLYSPPFPSEERLLYAPPGFCSVALMLF